LFQSEYIDVCDARREFVSGFNGSAGMIGIWIYLCTSMLVKLI